MTNSASELVSEYLDELRWDLLPIYIGLGGITLWLGALTVMFMTANGLPASETITFVRLSVLLGALFTVVFPFGMPAIGVVARRVR